MKRLNWKYLGYSLLAICFLEDRNSDCPWFGMAVAGLAVICFIVSGEEGKKTELT
jgi:hypothetical protein